MSYITKWSTKRKTTFFFFYILISIQYFYSPVFFYKVFVSFIKLYEGFPFYLSFIQQINSYLQLHKLNYIPIWYLSIFFLLNSNLGCSQSCYRNSVICNANNNNERENNYVIPPILHFD